MVRYGKRNVGCRLPERSRQLRDTGYARGRGHEVRGEAEAGRQESESKRATESLKGQTTRVCSRLPTAYPILRFRSNWLRMYSQSVSGVRSLVLKTLWSCLKRRKLCSASALFASTCSVTSCHGLRLFQVIVTENRTVNASYTLCTRTNE